MKAGIKTKSTGRKIFRLKRFVEIFHPLLLLMLVPAIFQARPAEAAEDPEVLYRKGRFAEAEKAYAELDMDHPRDVRYRYNRGCAAYRNSDYQGARSAFSSVLRRSEDKDVRLKAAYNLGNTAYKQGDFKSAAEYYRQAVLSDPSHGDAKYNLELALRALEKQKKEQEKAKSPQGEGEGKEKGEKSGDEASREPESRKPDAQKEHQDGKKNESRGEEGKEPQGQQKGETDEKRSAEQEAPEDLSGELKPLRDSESQAEGGKDEKAAGALSGIDRKKAEALLDNIKEDRSRYLRFLVPGDKKQGVVSGKDW